MTFNLFFLTISVMKKERTIEEIQHEQKVNKMYEEMKDRHITMFYTN
ncbi:YrzI family small protein [Cytobacillus sp. S13-E01]|nr:YrzI family small protein [Cytobacillus sp. S13-E01]MDF0728573.1 YrzI family small protein [Cytobacillus sp. S13-E01]